MKYIFYTSIAFIALLCACTSSPKSTATLADTTTVADTTIISAIPKREGYPVDYSSVKVIEQVYVTNRNGAPLKQEPDTSSISLENNTYGAKLDVIEVKDNWLGVLYYATRKNKTVQRWEKAYIQRSQTGKFTDIKLLPKDLNVVFSSTQNDKTENYTGGKTINNYLEMELIDKALFEEKKATAIAHIIQDTNAITKVKGIITLPCAQKNRIYKDNANGEENTEEYEYYGQIEVLNKYLVTGTYWEAWDCKLVDKTTGKEIAVGSIPNVAPNLNHMICIYENPYDESTELELYKISNTLPTHMVSLSFINWVPQLEKESIFWSNDGYLYVPVLHSAIYWKVSNAAKNNLTQFIRIKIKS